MKLFEKKKKTFPIPSGFDRSSVKMESSVCTGERTIGFYDPYEKKLVCAELVRSDDDIRAFYEKYGIKPE